MDLNSRADHPPTYVRSDVQGHDVLRPSSALSASPRYILLRDSSSSDSQGGSPLDLPLHRWQLCCL
jgi:hypothetical protein